MDFVGWLIIENGTALTWPEVKGHNSGCTKNLAENGYGSEFTQF